MSFYYLSAVKGDIAVHLLEEIAIERLQYLKSVLNDDDLTYSEYLVEGSVYDNIGHFVLCVVAIICKDEGLFRFLLQSEKKLFTRRLNSISAYDMRLFAKKLLRNIRKQVYISSNIDALQCLCEHLTIKDLAQHICSPSHTHECEAHKIGVNFKHCLPLIAKRQVELHKGSAAIPCGKWKQYFAILFKYNLSQRLRATDVTALKTDPRIIELCVKINRLMTPYLCGSYHTDKILLSKNVDDLSLSFPPCMQNLHTQLRKNHRLSHTQRFHYSLFLKDIGMPVEEAVQFWSSEYRQSPNGSHSCCHSWEKDEKKYLYGIRHMYGLEGCRKNYASVNCHRIQSLDSASSEGGCPFKVFELSKINKILGLNCDDPLMSQIVELKRKQCYTSACILHLQKQYLDVTYCDIENQYFNFTPVKYYMSVMKLKS